MTGPYQLARDTAVLCGAGLCKMPVPVVKAVTHVRRMRGGSQSHLMRCSDGHFYVVKFANNPQGAKILANELMAHEIATFLGLPVPPCAIVDVSPQLIGLTCEMVIEEPRKRTPCQSGPAFGSRHITENGCKYLEPGWDALPSEFLPIVNNLADFLGILVFDKWTCNTDGRQVVFGKRQGGYDAFMIDNGFCFNADAWTFPDAPLRALYRDKSVYRGAEGIECYEPWLERVEHMWHPEAMHTYADQIPPEWYESDRQGLERLVNTLDRRRSRIRELVAETLNILRNRIQIEHKGPKCKCGARGFPGVRTVSENYHEQ